MYLISSWRGGSVLSRFASNSSFGGNERARRPAATRGDWVWLSIPFRKTSLVIGATLFTWITLGLIAVSREFGLDTASFRPALWLVMLLNLPSLVVITLIYLALHLAGLRDFSPEFGSGGILMMGVMTPVLWLLIERGLVRRFSRVEEDVSGRGKE